VTEREAPENAPDTGIACLSLLARFLQHPIEPQTLQHLTAAEGATSERDLVRVARQTGLKARATDSSVDRLDRIDLPIMARNRQGGWFIIAKAADGKVLIQDPLVGRPETLTPEDLAERWEGRAIFLTTRARLGGALRKFDVTWFIPAIVRYRRLFGEVLVASFFLQLFALITPLFFQVVIDKVLVHKGLTTLDVLVIGLIAVSVFEVILGGLRTYVFSHTTSRVDVELGGRLFHHLVSLPLNYFQARRVGDSVARVRELDTIRNFLTGSALTLVIDLFFTIVFLVVMYFYSPTLTYIVIGAIPFYIALSVIVTPILRRRLDERFRRGAENQAFLVEAVTGVETLKAMAIEPQMQRRWEDQLAGYVRASFRASNLGNIASQVAQFINKITVALTLWFGAQLVIDGDITIGQLIAFNMLAGRVSGPVLRLAQLWQQFQEARISIDRLGDILNAEAEPAFSPSRTRLGTLKGAVKFDHITFRYRPDGPEILADVSLDIPAGQIVGIVGPSGSGKSTLAKLVQRLYVPERGRIMVDGADLSTVDPAWLRRQVGVVLQENVLFNRSVRENIAIADPGMPMEKVVQAAQLAGAHEFILGLSEGYDTRLGERGSDLSGGQRQRIAIARALVGDPRILIFDEATSALDYESESAIQKNMREICEGRTVLIVAHRLAAVRNAHRIITVDAGRIAEDGTHEELLQQGGRYARLFALQTGESHV